MPFLKANSPKSPATSSGCTDVNKLLHSVRAKLEKLVTHQTHEQISELVNNDSNLDHPDRKAMTRERLSQLGAIPKLAFCRLENFRLMRVLGVGSYGKVFLVRMKSHRLLPDSLFPKRFPQVVGPQVGKNYGSAIPVATNNEAENEFWPEGLDPDSDLCSKFWIPKAAVTMEDSVFQHYYAMKVIRKNLILKQSNDLHHLQTELRALRQISHPFLVCVLRLNLAVAGSALSLLSAIVRRYASRRYQDLYRLGLIFTDVIVLVREIDVT